MLANLVKRCFSSKTDLGSSLFRQKRELHKWDAFSTYMQPPKNIVEIDPTQWKDLDFSEFFRDDKEKVRFYLADVPRTPKETNSPTGSWMKLMIPFSKSKKLSKDFQRFDSASLRIGKVLEILDLMAGIVSYGYCYQTPQNRVQINVTACIDNFKFFDTFRTGLDMNVYTYVTYVGKSSLEIRLDVFQGAKEELYVTTVTYLFAARDFANPMKSTKVPELDLSQEEDPEKAKIRYSQGLEHQKYRKDLSLSSRFKIPPNAEEGLELHTVILMGNQKDKSAMMKSMSSTKIEKTLIMHGQDRNVHGKIFGGYLTREAFELAWTCAYLHGNMKALPNILNIDDINFWTPVDVGSIMRFTAQITYVEGPIIHVSVACEELLYDMETRKTTEIHLTFTYDAPIPSVYPETYLDGMHYLEGKRRVMQVLKD